MASAAQERIGAIVDDRYRILERMAEGSMGVVYRAERVPVGKAVAIKFLHPAVAAYPEFQERFDRETHVMSKLAHPHCASVLDFGVEDGAPYIVMEYVGGTTLRDLLDDGPLPPLRALALARQLAAGLAHAHAQDIVHRDIKPANLMITEETGTGSHLRILDFGLARLCSAVGSNATASHIAIGTPSYMAPEQTLGGTVDARADVYAAGVVLFEMLTGEKPFEADETLDLLAMHRGAKVPRLADVTSAPIPEGVQEIVDKAMAKMPADRYQSAIELAHAIDAVAGRPPTITEIADEEEDEAEDAAEEDEEAAPPARDSSARWFGLVILLLWVAGAAVYWIETRSSSGTPATPAAATTAATTNPPTVASKRAAPPPAPPSPSPKVDPPPAPAPDVPATSVADAIQLIKDGKRELAMTSLRALAKKQPKNAQIPFLIGNLDFDQSAGTAAIDQYRAAIALDRAYKGNAVLARNTIQLLASAKTRSRATALLRAAGRPALPYLRDAAKNDSSAAVRKAAGAIARSIR
ncbi:MAG TPA: serine/threonine-protein kinase [Kofleriaceae bacterium]|nr:serine/threonine-protein kinase [Kofleriaceae bacterium]